MLAQVTMSAQVFKSALAISKDKIMPLRKCVSSDLLRVCKIAMPWYKDIFGVQTEYVATYYPSETFLLFDMYIRYNGRLYSCTSTCDTNPVHNILSRYNSVLEMAEYLQLVLQHHEQDEYESLLLFPKEFKYGEGLKMLALEEYLERYEPHRYKQLKAMEHEKWVMLKASMGIK